MGPLQKQLEQGAVLCAEGFLFELERRGYMQAGPFVPEVVLDHPDVLRQLHLDFLRAGSDITVAFTYYAHREKMRQIGREEDIETLNRHALRIARQVADEAGSLMAGNICNTWVYDHERHEETAPQVRAMYEEQVRWAQEEGVDCVIAETLFYLGEAEIALEVIRSFDLEAVIMLGPFHERTRDGVSWAEACYRLREQGATVVGVNCAQGPQTMWPILQQIRQQIQGPVGALPVPYRTNEQVPVFTQLRDMDGEQAFPINLDPHYISRKEVARFARDAYAAGIRFLGLCCGNAPHFFRAMAEAIGRSVEASHQSPDMSKHAMLGSSRVVQNHNREYRQDWSVDKRE